MKSLLSLYPPSPHAGGPRGQSQGVEQITTAVSQLDQVTQTNAASAEEAASVSEELTAQAHEMQQLVEALSAIVGAAAVDRATADDSQPNQLVDRRKHNSHTLPVHD